MTRIPVPLFMVKNAIRRFKKKADWANINRSRAGFEKLTNRFSYRSKKCSYVYEDVGHCRGEWIRPIGADSNKVLLYFHGGGYAVGSTNTHRSLLTRLALSAKVNIFSFEYRLAPEHPYPAALKDATMAFDWLINKGFQQNKIAFGGDSAGGGLTLGTLLSLRDNDKPLPACAICLSPWTDLTLSGTSHHDTLVDEPMLTKEAFPLWASNYYGTFNPKTPYISPLFADCKGLPPIYIQVGTAESLYSDSIDFYSKAKQDGVHIELDVYEHYFHVFQSFWQVLPKANKAIKKLGDFVVDKLR